MEKKIGVFYGCSMGTTDALPRLIAKETGVLAVD